MTCLQQKERQKTKGFTKVSYEPYLNHFNNILIYIFDILPTGVGNFCSKAAFIIHFYNYVLSLQKKKTKKNLK